ncbi:MarR family transcriptional regulator [Viridibacillus sp. FSL R5-0477]|uniref:Uncharacterized protein n=1 Tax=Viridibacillus arenosi FSL R5-213 TaxID=1227360 RepID=W4EV89_9BACL|nr:MarR family transcriptional regulator [Viridibacillus arenosi]ETT84159.1 hypothetical protein C176_12363 [Viridibacillus arenosi FSL R5-213]
MDINNYMSPTEAAFRWGIPTSTMQERLKSRTNKMTNELEQMKEKGLIKYFKLPDAKRGEWIISTTAMEKWYGPEPLK